MSHLYAMTEATSALGWNLRSRCGSRLISRWSVRIYTAKIPHIPHWLMESWTTVWYDMDTFAFLECHFKSMLHVLVCKVFFNVFKAYMHPFNCCSLVLPPGHQWKGQALFDMWEESCRLLGTLWILGSGAAMFPHWLFQSHYWNLTGRFTAWRH